MYFKSKIIHWSLRRSEKLHFEKKLHKGPKRLLFRCTCVMTTAAVFVSLSKRWILKASDHDGSAIDYAQAQEVSI